MALSIHFVITKCLLSFSGKNLVILRDLLLINIKVMLVNSRVWLETRPFLLKTVKSTSHDILCVPEINIAEDAFLNLIKARRDMKILWVLKKKIKKFKLLYNIKPPIWQWMRESFDWEIWRYSKFNEKMSLGTKKKCTTPVYISLVIW